MGHEAVDRERLLTHFESRLARDPLSRCFVPLADLYRQNGRIDDACRVLEAGIAQHPQYVSALVALGQLRDELADADGARDMLGRALARDPDNLVALRLLAADAEGRGDWVAAVPRLERLSRLEPDDLVIHDRLRDARRHLADTVPPAPLAAPAPESQLAEAAGNGLATLTLADLFLRQGHRDQARRILLQLAAATPGRPDVQERLAALEKAEEEAPAPAVPPPAAASAVPRERIRRRTAADRQADHERFKAWLERARSEESGH